jgi:hypothetical protein
MVDQRRKIGVDDCYVPALRRRLAGRSPLFGKELVTACPDAIRPARATESGA